MILYEYECQECGHEFAALNAIEDREKANCPICAGIARKLISAATPMLDGSDPGFPTAADKWEREHEKANLDELKSLGLR